MLDNEAALAALERGDHKPSSTYVGIGARHWGHAFFRLSHSVTHGSQNSWRQGRRTRVRPVVGSSRQMAHGAACRKKRTNVRCGSASITSVGTLSSSSSPTCKSSSSLSSASSESPS
jgi:hypothetical protein